MGTHQSKFMPVVEPIDATKLMLAEKSKETIDADQKSIEEPGEATPEKNASEEAEEAMKTIEDQEPDEVTCYADQESVFFAKMKAEEDDRDYAEQATIASTAGDGNTHFESGGIPTTYFNNRAVEFTEKLSLERAKRNYLEN